MSEFHTIQSTIPHDKSQFIKAQRNKVLTPAVVAGESFNFLTMNSQYIGQVKHRHHHLNKKKRANKKKK
mgnify:CR=1 FL=1